MSDEKQSPPVEETKNAIRISNVTKVYGATIALAGVSFEVKQGEIFGLLGPNGAGKTTSIRILKGMINPTSGEAFILGKRISDDPNWAKEHTGYLPEEGSLIGRLTPLELSEFIGGLFGVSAANSRNRSIELFRMFELYEKKDELVEKLSRGMKQKLSIICSLIHDPDILLMDEPLASLDPSAAKMVKDFIKYLSREKEKTIIISSHRLSLVEDVCDRVAIIHQGAIIAEGTPKTIMQETNTTSLEDAYLAVIPGYKSPVITSEGTIVETAAENNTQDASEQSELKTDESLN
ncbi:MAG: ABC transporter ATP-binding protein [Candidatus Heimdallarchaeota archaeon]